MNAPESFNVLEGDTASVDLYATRSTNLVGSPSGIHIDSSPFADPGGGSPNYILRFEGFKNPSVNGFVVTIPEPSMLAVLAVPLALLRRRRSSCRFF